MRLLEFKQEIGLRARIIVANTRYSLTEGFAYTANNWGGLASTVVFMITFLVFISVLYGNVKSIAGYNYSQMLVFVLVQQINFYLTWAFSIGSVVRLGEAVKTGGLDLIMTKPMPHLWFVTFRKIDLQLLVFNAIPATLPLLFLVSRNHDFSLTLPGLILGGGMIILGQIFLHCFQFILTLGSFWTGEPKGFESLMYQLGNFNEPLPFEAYSSIFRFGFFVIFPTILHTAATTSYLLGKTQGVGLFLFFAVATIAAVYLKIYLWKVALRHYVSASS